jgi:phosphatidylglycerophosphatase A
MKNAKSGYFSMLLARLGPVGDLEAPGTVATVLTLPLVFWLRSTVPGFYEYGFLLLVSIFVTKIIIERACDYLGNHNDPAEIVLDELVGCLVVFWGVPLTTQTLVIGCMLFRFFDISKVCGVSYCERLPGGWGIVLDDVAAGLLSNMVLCLLF